MPSNVKFKQLSIDDIHQLYEWLQEQHVRLFWDDGDRTINQVKEHYLKADDVKRYLFLINDEPVGYIQSYEINHMHEYAEFILKNETSIGIDFFIGSKKFLNKGLAIIILTQFILLYCKVADRIIVDPIPRNKKAIHIYKEYGFKKVGTAMYQTKLHEIMVIDLPRQKLA